MLFRYTSFKESNGMKQKHARQGDQKIPQRQHHFEQGILSSSICSKDDEKEEQKREGAGKTKNKGKRGKGEKRVRGFSDDDGTAWRSVK